MSADAIRISMYSLRYIKGTYEAATNVMRYDSPLLWCNAIWFWLDSTQCDSMQYDTMEKKLCQQFNIVQIVCFYFFGSDRQQIVN